MTPQSSSGTAATSVPGPSNTTSSADGRGMQGLSSSSSLPFSFLVTFVAIFLFFLGCGLSSRRVTRTIRRNLGLEVTGLGGDRRVARIPCKRPLLWDAFPHEVSPPGPGCTGVDDRVFSRPWDVLAPVSATYVRTPTPRPAPAAAPTLGPQIASTPRWPLGGVGFAASRGLMRSIPRLPPPPTPRVPPTPTASRSATAAPRRTAPEMYWRGRRVPDWIARPLMPDSLDRPLEGIAFDSDARSEGLMPDETSEGDQEVQALQVVVLVSMPSPDRARAFRVRAKALEAERRESGSSGEFCAGIEVSAEKTIGEYLLGTVRVPWKEG